MFLTSAAPGSTATRGKAAYTLVAIGDADAGWGRSMTTPQQSGWFPDPYGKDAYRYFDGTNWTAGTSPVPGYLAPAPPQPEHLAPLSPQPQPYKWWIPPQRQQPKGTQVVVKGPDTTIHFVLTVLTCGLWLPIWIIAALVGKRTIKYK